MKLEERVIDEDRVEYGIGNGLYIVCVRDPRSGKVVGSRVQGEATGGERADQIVARSGLPADYRDQVLTAARAYFENRDTATN